MIRIAISVRADTARIALLSGDSLTEYAIWHFNQPGDIGDIFAARIIARVPAMAGSFADLGGMTGFLPDSASLRLTEGSYFAARIARCAQSGKGPRIAALSQPVEPKPGLIQPGLGPLADLALRYPGAPIQIDDYALIALLRARCGPLAPRLSYRTRGFDAVLEDEIATLSEATAELPNGARIHVTPAPALTAIDIDAGAASAENRAKAQAQRALNIALLPAVARQILLRNLSGAILIDFAGMKSAARAALLPALEHALKSDPLRPKCLGFSHLGFAEITRPRIRPALHEFPR